jgi:pimeloyl-ACP methyl ester carboxylesterase
VGQVAVDRPELVRGLVVVASACRLGPRGRQVQQEPSRELFEQTAAGVVDGRAHIYPEWGHLRTSMSSATANLTLGFLLAALRN